MLYVKWRGEISRNSSDYRACPDTLLLCKGNEENQRQRGLCPTDHVGPWQGCKIKYRIVSYILSSDKQQIIFNISMSHTKILLVVYLKL